MDFTKTIIPLAFMASESITHSGLASWTIESEPIRVRGIIIKYSVGDRSLRPPRLTLDPEKDALTVCSASHCTAFEGNL